MIYNDVSSVPRCRVVTAENTKSQTYQMRWRSIWAEMLTSIDPNVGNGIALPYWSIALKNFFDTVEIKEEDQESVKVFNDMIMMISRLKMVSEATATQTQIQGNTFQSAQIGLQMQQIMQAMQATQQQITPTSHALPRPQQEVNYPAEGESINPQPEVSPQLSTQPGLSEMVG